jgi:2,5-diketo-D-gluconate reductase A
MHPAQAVLAAGARCNLRGAGWFSSQPIFRRKTMSDHTSPGHKAALGEDRNAALPGGVPFAPLNDGNAIPQLGFGVWQVPNDEVTNVVGEAIRAGYRAIDTAQGYDNEAGVGRAIREADVDREDLFITSKIRTKSMGADARKGIEESLKALGLDYLDLFLIHWPIPAHNNYVETWKAFIKAREDGLVRSIGVSNFLPEYLGRIIDETGVAPAINQVETHPYYQQRDVRQFHFQNRIQLESYSPLGSGEVLKDPVIGEIARKHGKTPAQVIIRWHLQEGLVVIPKSTHAERIRDNLDVFGFELDEADMDRIATLDKPDGKTLDDPATNNNIW